MSLLFHKFLLTKKNICSSLCHEEVFWGTNINWRMGFLDFRYTCYQTLANMIPVKMIMQVGSCFNFSKIIFETSILPILLACADDIINLEIKYFVEECNFGAFDINISHWKHINWKKSTSYIKYYIYIYLY